MGLFNLFKRESEGNGISYDGGSGDSIDDAIVIHAPNSVVGIMAEYAYIENQYGVKDQDWTLSMQSQLSKNGRDFDMLSIELKDGTEKSFYFLPFKPGASHPVASAPFKALKCFCLFGLWPKIQAPCSAGGR
jgi:hypothetical protein